MGEMAPTDADSSYKVRCFRILLKDRALYYLPVPVMIKFYGLLCAEELQNSDQYHQIITIVVIVAVAVVVVVVVVIVVVVVVTAIAATMLTNKRVHHSFVQSAPMGVLVRTARCSTAL